MLGVILPAILIAAGVMVYSNSFHAEMVFDDHPFIIADPAVHMTELSWEGIKRAALEGFPAHRYLPNISFAINYYIGALDPFGYHVVNLAIHLLTGLFLFSLIKNTLRVYPCPTREGMNPSPTTAGIIINRRDSRPTDHPVGCGVYPRPDTEGVYPSPEREGVKPSPTWTGETPDAGDWIPQIIAFFAVLIWVVQPVGTQAVTYICQRMASMVALFYVLSLLLYIKGRMAMGQGRVCPRPNREDVKPSPTPENAGAYPGPEHCKPNTVGAGFTPDRNRTTPDNVGAGFIPDRNKMASIFSFRPAAGGRKALPYGSSHPDQILFPILYFTGSALAALCAIATKENAGTLPIAILLYEWFFFQDLRVHWSRKQVLWSLFFLLAFGGAVVWYMGGNPLIRLMNSYNIRDFNMLERTLTQFRIVIYYISLFFFAPPGRLNLDHDYPLSIALFSPPTTFICMIAITALILFTGFIAKKERLISFCILWFFLTQATESTIIGIELIFEHRTYIPFMMMSLMLVMIIFRVFRFQMAGVYSPSTREGMNPSPTAAGTIINTRDSRPTDHPVGCGVYPRPEREGVKPSPTTAKTYGVYFLLCAIVLLFSVWTYQRNLDWQDPVRFWTDALAKSSDKQRAHQNLAFAYQQQEKWDLAVRHYQKSLDMDKSTKKTDFATLANLGAALLKLDHYFDAAYYYTKAMGEKNAAANILHPLAHALSRIGEFEEAKQYYQLVLNIHPQDALARKELDALTAFSNQFPDPGDQIRQLLSAMPENSALLLKQGEIFLRQGENEKAIAAFQKAEAMTGDHDAMLRQALVSRLARAYAVSRRFGEAESAYLRLIALAPDNGMAYYNLASVYAVTGNVPKAKEFLKKAEENGIQTQEKIRTDPNFVNLEF